MVFKFRIMSSFDLFAQIESDFHANPQRTCAVLDNETKSRAFALVILKMLTAAGGLGQSNSGGNFRPS